MSLRKSDLVGKGKVSLYTRKLFPKIATSKGGRISLDVYLWNDEAALNDRRQSMQQREEGASLAFFSPTLFRIFLTGKGRSIALCEEKPARLGELHFCLPHLTSSIVAHEAFHVTAHIARISGNHNFGCQRPMNDEEALATIHDRIFELVLRKCGRIAARPPR